MPTPLPVPSKAAIRTLRSIALGTSCAIGVIVEHRRRRISTLQTAVANKKKLKSSRQYHHGGSGELFRQLDGAAVTEHALQWHEKDGYELKNRPKPEVSDSATYDASSPEDHQAFDLLQGEVKPNHIQAPQPQPPTSQHASILTTSRIPISQADLSMRTAMIDKVAETRQAEPSTTRKRSRIQSIETLLASADREQLDLAVSLFLSYAPSMASSPILDRWLDLSVRLSKECQANSRWENAGRILMAVVELGPLDEAQYFAYNPSSIIEFLLRQPEPDTPCSEENVLSAAKLFRVELKNKQAVGEPHMERVGRHLISECLGNQRYLLARYIYWTTLRWAENPEEFVRWAIRHFFEHDDHKIVIKIFLLHYSRMTSVVIEDFNQTMDYVLGSIQAMKGSKADSILEAYARLECPGNNKLRTRWVMRLLQAYWDRHGDISKVTRLFEKAVALGILDKVSHPQAVYRTIIDMAVKAGDEELAHSYTGRLVHDYPDMMDEISLKLAALNAKAGDWDSVLQVFRQVRPSELARPAEYDDVFILILKTFADTHTATETRDFAMMYVRDVGVKFHPYMVTLLAKKYGEARDVKGFMAWLELSSREGFALNAGFCNTVLHNCSKTWQMSFPELQMIHSKLETLNQHCSDEVTRRILSQAAQREGRTFSRTRPTATTLSKLAYSGRSTDARDIYEAMNQELMNNRPVSAVMIYKRAIRFGVPFSSHCLRLAVLAMLRGKDSVSSASSALKMIQDAHDQGHDVRFAVSTFIKCQIDTFCGNDRDMIIHMRNLISRFESSQVVISPAVLTHMAAACAKIGQYEKAIALCNLARDRSGASNLCFSKQSFKALTTAYCQLYDIGGMNSLIDDICQSRFSTDKYLLSHLKSIRRSLNKTEATDAKTALINIIERGIQRMTEDRAEARTEGKLISEKTLRIVGDALADLQSREPENGALQRHTAEIGATGMVSVDDPGRVIAIG